MNKKRLVAVSVLILGFGAISAGGDGKKMSQAEAELVLMDYLKGEHNALVRGCSNNRSKTECDKLHELLNTTLKKERNEIIEIEESWDDYTKFACAVTLKSKNIFQCNCRGLSTKERTTCNLKIKNIERQKGDRESSCRVVAAAMKVEWVAQLNSVREAFKTI